jgi:hypothetical protein
VSAVSKVCVSACTHWGERTSGTGNARDSAQKSPANEAQSSNSREFEGPDNAREEAQDRIGWGMCGGTYCYSRTSVT